jgi:hypothetical protein
MFCSGSLHMLTMSKYNQASRAAGGPLVVLSTPDVHVQCVKHSQRLWGLDENEGLHSTACMCSLLHVLVHAAGVAAV